MLSQEAQDLLFRRAPTANTFTDERIDGEHKVLAVITIGKPGKDALRDRVARLDDDEVVTSV